MTSESLELWLDEKQRTEVISTIVSIIRVKGVPPNVYQAALTIMGWLARRKPSESPCQIGVVEAQRQMAHASK